MTISSRTPEGSPIRCTICGTENALEPAYPSGDAICPNCGALLWTLRDVLAKHTAQPLDKLPLNSSLSDLGQDSLEMVELVMELEEAIGFTIHDDIAERIQSVEDLLRYIIQSRRRRGQ